MKDQKVSTTLGTFILIIITATVTGFVLICFKNYPVKDEVKLTTVSDQKIDIENWQVYRNEEYNFEFMHPNNWKVVEPDAREWLMGSDFQLIAKDSDANKTYFSILVWSSVDFSSAEQGLMDRVGKRIVVENKYNKNINGADVFCIEDGIHEKERLAREYKCAFLKDEKLIIFSIYKEVETLGINESIKKNKNLGNSKYFEEIIKSVKIQNQEKSQEIFYNADGSIDTTNWQRIELGKVINFLAPKDWEDLGGLGQIGYRYDTDESIEIGLHGGPLDCGIGCVLENAISDRVNRFVDEYDECKIIINEQYYKFLRCQKFENGQYRLIYVKIEENKQCDCFEVNYLWAICNQGVACSDENNEIVKEIFNSASFDDNRFLDL